MRYAIADAAENLVPDSGGGSVQQVSVHFDGNYELPLQVEPPVATARFVTALRIWFSADSNLLRSA